MWLPCLPLVLSPARSLVRASARFTHPPARRHYGAKTGGTNIFGAVCLLGVVFVVVYLLSNQNNGAPPPRRACDSARRTAAAPPRACAAWMTVRRGRESRGGERAWYTYRYYTEYVL